MKGLTLERMAAACEATLIGCCSDIKKEAAGIVIDSRKVEKDFVFAALQGERVDGHDFILQAFAAGSMAVISERELSDPPGPYLLVKSSRDALKKIAALYLDILDIPVVGITGSVGKTSTKEMIASVLAQKYNVHKTAGNYNNEIGLPLTVFGLTTAHEAAVLEMGISDFGEMTRLAQVARPNVAVITNIGICHLENLSTRDGILKAKTEIFDYLKEEAAVILNGDDDKLCTIAEVQGKVPCFYGIGRAKPAGAVYEEKSVYADHISNHGLHGIDFDLHISGNVHAVHVTIPGEHNIYNAMAAAAAGLALGLTEQQICAGIEAARTIDGRTNLISAHDYLVIDDCYNANPVSMKAAIDVLAQAAGRTIAVLGDMGELGVDEKQLHYEVGAYLAEKNIDVLFAAGELSREIVRGVTEKQGRTRVFHFDTRDALLARLTAFVKKDDTVLVKASHFMGYPQIVSALTEQE